MTWSALREEIVELFAPLAVPDVWSRISMFRVVVPTERDARTRCVERDYKRRVYGVQWAAAKQSEALRLQQRSILVRAMRERGIPFRKIAAQLGVSVGAAAAAARVTS